MSRMSLVSQSLTHILDEGLRVCVTESARDCEESDVVFRFVFQENVDAIPLSVDDF